MAEIDKIIYKHILLLLGLQDLRKSCFFRAVLAYPSTSLSALPKSAACKAVLWESGLLDLLATSTRTLLQNLQPWWAVKGRVPKGRAEKQEIFTHWWSRGSYWLAQFMETTEKESKCWKWVLQRKRGKFLYKNSDQVFLETNTF